MAPQPGAPPVTNRSIPIEYPTNPDCMVDDHMVPFKERGLRGKAGSAPPLDLDKGSRGLVRIPGRMGSLIMGHNGPTVGKKKEMSKKFWFQMVYCEWSSMDDLLARLQALQPTRAEDELAKLRRRAAEDDDIEVGTSTLSLKDPLSGMRITKPVRSSKCTHLQCFDARWWLESNRSHPQWLCPHCSKELKFDEVICDGYFLSILNAVPDSYDEVVLESNGDWHTADEKYGGAEWMAANGSAPPPAVTTPVVEEKPVIKRSRSASSDPADRSKRRAIEILSDSDDEPAPKAVNGHANGAVSVSAAATPTSARSTAPPQLAVIDLTLSDSDDDDEPAPHFPRPGGSSTSLGVAGSGARPATVNKLPSARDVPVYAQGLPAHVHLPQPIYSPKTVAQPYNAPLQRNDVPPPNKR
ncbi:chromosome condensation-related protein [Trichosporon asahii var. asahii CBS 2479]|uniref:Chromosome condensation-related protein n=1 Tax=Trichosporon asahii var. asahii (strain ATCC 90039 / CBS 2479 / JCM 2466 / KCTC 7840 / NBRC 103889/ NCYC 2677 / UAMH 7654) TaxID=1186058 RepID=J6F260_TRIAS|nr:chromosome condensation-related protein [Trichosporon asahii var. asahii CBS 2479]EJT49282.1 chromosome condensation-related protein [Trichosporon asahii var. asahii CBS 2479]